MTIQTIHLNGQTIQWDDATGQQVGAPATNGTAPMSGGTVAGGAANGLPLGQLRTSDGTQTYVIGPNGQAVIVAPGEVQGLLQQGGYSMPTADQQAWVQNEMAYKNPGFYPTNGAPATAGAPNASAPTQPGASTGNGIADVQASVDNTLRQNGLEQLIPMVDQWIRQGLYTSWSQIEVQLEDPSTPAGKIVDQIYPELRMLREAGKEPLSISQIQDLRSQYRQIFQQHDTPVDFYDQPSDFTSLIVGGKSPNELNQDLMDWRKVADEAAADPENASTLAELHRIYGITPDSGAFLAYVIDPQRGLDTIEKQINSARLSSTAARAGFGGLDQGQAERLAAAGIDPSAAGSTFSQLARSGQLTNGIVGVQGETLSRDEQLAAAFGNDAAAQAKLGRITQQRTAEFADGGQAAAGRGETGLSVAH